MSNELHRRGAGRLAATVTAIAITMPCVVSASDLNSNYAPSPNAEAAPRIKVVRFVSDSAVELAEGRRTYPITRGERHGAWTFMGVTSGQNSYAILEDFHTKDGHILFVDAGGVQIDLPKTAESDIKNSDKLFLGHSRDEVSASATDLLGNEILSHNGDPEYASIEDILPKSGVIPPDENDLKNPTLEGFIGTPDTSDKVYFFRGGDTANFVPNIFSLRLRKFVSKEPFFKG